MINGVVGLENKIAVVPSERKQDEEIAKEVTSAINRNRYLNIDDINVAVNNQVVYLTGKVIDNWTAIVLEDITGFTTGVKDVENNVEILTE